MRLSTIRNRASGNFALDKPNRTKVKVTFRNYIAYALLYASEKIKGVACHVL